LDGLMFHRHVLQPALPEKAALHDNHVILCWLQQSADMLYSLQRIQGVRLWAAPCDVMMIRQQCDTHFYVTKNNGPSCLQPKQHPSDTTGPAMWRDCWEHID
jgi:hypothetical protein